MRPRLDERAHVAVADGTRLCDAEATTRKEAIALRAEFEPTLRALAEDAVESVRNAAKDELEDREW